MVNDASSPFRKLTDHNILFSKLRVPGMQLGPELRSLWTDQEIAAAVFMNNGGSKWQFCEGNRLDTDVDYFTAAQELNVTEKFLQDHRRSSREDRVEQAFNKGDAILPRDLPVGTAERTPLREMNWELADRRRLVGWWIGAFPSHRSQICQICNHPIPEEGGGRDHVARCMLTRNLDIELVQDPMQLSHFPAAALRRKASTDPITLSIWVIHSMAAKSWDNSALADNLKLALKAIGTDCLGRDGPATEATDSRRNREPP